MNIPDGCEKCYYTGYKGRKAIYEVIPIDNEISNAIKDGINNVDDILKRKGITTIKEAATMLYEQNETSYEEILPIIQTI